MTQATDIPLIDIRPDHWEIVRDILQKHVPQYEVWAFGSRAKWTAKPYSDLDLAIITEAPLSSGESAALADEFSESDLPWKVDVVDWAVTTETFRKIITRDKVVVQRSSNGNPIEWPIMRLGDTVDLMTGFPFKSQHYTDEQDAPKLLRGDNVAQGVLRWDGAKRWPLSMINGTENYWLKEGDIVLAMDRPWIDAGLKYASVRKVDTPSLLVQRVARLRGTKRLDSKFLRYVIGSKDFTDHVLAVQTGTAVPHISRNQIKAYSFSLPPLSEQCAIATVLSSLDDKIDLNRQMNETLEAMARAVFKDWFVDFGPVRAKAEGRQPPGLSPDIAALFPDALDDEDKPVGWPLKKWGDVASLEYGKRLENYQDAGGQYPVFGTNGPIGSHHAALCQEAGVIIGRKGAYRGVHFSHGPFYVIDTAFYLKPKIPCSRRWAYYCILSVDINSMDSGSAIPSTSRDDFYNLDVIEPSGPIQSKFDEMLSPIWERQAANESESRALAQLRDLLLPKLMSGEIRLKDAEKVVEAVL